MTEDPRDTELERAFREGLRQAADRTEVGVPLVARAHAGARVRRRRRWAVVGAVAATVVAASGAAVAVRSGDGGQRPDHRPDDHAVAEPSTPITEWRPESWRNLTVDVPADWGWGTAPVEMSFDKGEPLLCGGPGATVSADGDRAVNAKQQTPWVGRPIMLSDACLGAPFPTPEAPYVWLGAAIDPGTVDLGDGYTQETVEALGSTVTVATRDPAVRQHVIDSARATTGCLARLDARPAVQATPIEGLNPVHSAEVCAYQKKGGFFWLTYATTLDQAAAQTLYSGDATGKGAAQEFCPEGGEEYVHITFSGRDAMGNAELTSDEVIDPVCRQVELGTGVVLPLTDEGMASWSRNGLQAVLFAFIGMLG
jgi:hypothetical protein